jgi:hypothetical protein
LADGLERINVRTFYRFESSCGINVPGPLFRNAII